MSRFEPWRRYMLLGAVLLLAYYLGVAITKAEGPAWLGTGVHVLGYGLLAVGFVTRMRERSEQLNRMQERDDSEPAEEDQPPQA